MKENLDEIYQLYVQDIYRFLLSLCQNHHTAEDLVQETFVRAYLYLENYQSGNVKTWLFTIAHHVFIDYYRKQKRIIIKEQNFFLSLFSRKKSIEEEIMIQEELQEIITLIEELPIKHKYAVLLHDFHHLTHNEAAEVMGVKLSHFKVLLFRGRQAIRNKKGANKHE